MGKNIKLNEDEKVSMSDSWNGATLECDDLGKQCDNHWILSCTMPSIMFRVLVAM